MLKKILTLFTLFFLIQPSHANHHESWVEMTRRDLKTIYQQILMNHPGPYDQNNPQFKTWLEEGFKKYYDLAEEVTSFEGYSYIMYGYTNGFQDMHITYRTTLARDKINWPGFVLRYQNGKMFVHSVSRDKTQFPETLPKSSELISCDGKKANDLIKEVIFPYFGIADLEAHWTPLTSRFFLDYGNPFVQRPKQCLFKFKNRTIDHKLTWHPIPKPHAMKLVRSAGFGPPPKLNFRNIGQNNYWISLPHFLFEGQQVVEMKNILKKMRNKPIQKASYIVFDLRGNSGGNSQWVHSILETLYGKKYLEIKKRLKKPVISEWRVSKDNFRVLYNVAQSIGDQFGEAANNHKLYYYVAQQMKNALQTGQKFVSGPAKKSEPPNAQDPQNPVRSHIYLLTDGQCASACLEFVDQVFYLSGKNKTTHIGQSTSADSVYMHARTIGLPSSLGKLNFSIMVYRNRARGNNEPYYPQYKWEKAIWDTRGLQEWIKKLHRNKR